jgi:site-specific DNA-cytosine methylase
VLSLFLAAGGVFVYTSNQNVVATAGAAIPQDRSRLLMEAMKEEVFQLESDRLNGKINAQDYQTAKAALDKTLQRAVQRQSKAT